MDADQLLDIAFSHAVKKASAKKIRRDVENKVKELEIMKVKQVQKILDKQLSKYFDLGNKEITEFQRALIDTMVDLDEMYKNLNRVKNSRNIIKKLTSKYIKRMAEAGNRERLNKEKNAYYGRVSSIIKKIKFNDIELFAKKVNYLPQILEMETIIIAGFPSVGKSEILKGLSGRQIKTAAYPFTTREVLIGYMKDRYKKIQLVDTPGILDRPFEERNKIEKRAILAINHLSENIVYVIDPSESCGFPLEDQMSLLKSIKKSFDANILVVATKKDLQYRDFDADIHINALDSDDILKLKEKMIKFFH